MGMTKYLILVAMLGCGTKPPVDTENQCLPVTTCNVDQYEKVGPKGDKGPVGQTGPSGPSGQNGKDAGTVATSSSIKCSGIYYNYRFNYTLKTFSDGVRFVKCSAQSMSSEYASFDFNEYSTSDTEFQTAPCLLYGTILDCRDTVGYWIFNVNNENEKVIGTYIDSDSSYDGTSVGFQPSECVFQ